MSVIQPLKEQNLPDNCYVFKHSTRCPISAGAAEEVRVSKFDLPLYWINVIEQRPLSNWISDAYQTEHDSPQLLKIMGGKVEKNWTHHRITARVFEE